MIEKANADAGAIAALGRHGGVVEEAQAGGRYVVECRAADGALRWSDGIDNLVTNVGKANALDNQLAGVSYTAAWYIGLISSVSYVAGVLATDTAAAHGGWTEDQSYTQGTRPAASFAAASGGSKSTSTASVFSMNAGVTIKGCFLTSSSTKGGTAGTLYSCGLFSGGDKVLQSGDTLNVSYTATM